VLFLFVIMLLGAEAIAGEFKARNLVFPGALAVILIAEAAYILITRARPVGDVLEPGTTVNTMDNLRELGMSLFQRYLLPFEITSILLLVAMVGVIVLVQKEKRVF